MLLNIHILAGQDISLVRTEPDDPQQLPCPHQRQVFQCQITIPVLSLAWFLPNGDILEFGVLRSVGDTRNSSDGNYRATLTHKMEDGVQIPARFLYTSTLLVLKSENGSNITCGELDASVEFELSTTVAISGMNYHVLPQLLSV